MDVQCRYASGATTTKDLEPKSKEKERLDKAKSKRAEPPPILLMDEREAISVISLEDAGKLAKKRGLYLVESVDHGMKSGKQVYKLVSKSQFYGDDWKTKKEGTDPQGKKPKEEKSVLLKGKISDHDVAIKTKQILKLVEKGHTVRVSIGQVGIQNQNPEAVYKVMENLLKDEPVKILQKVVTSAQVRFQILPSKDTDAKPNAPQNTKDKVKSESVSDKP
ncbi:unnamed protein product [Allacma fusca]|uniref:Translation initiation factor IF-3 n=1 Tax=Allacma fusca TaxID=39272 RepID=A0A8J2KSK2_9HEXA|nr:unnamed protein product [Allacma fusca]